jgi:hypothetical protein
MVPENMADIQMSALIMMRWEPRIQAYGDALMQPMKKLQAQTAGIGMVTESAEAAFSVEHP